jgi:nicotinate phosphoribosyltransferase
LRFQPEELDYLRKAFPWIHNDYINFLSFWQPRYEDFEISHEGPSGLKITFKGVQEFISFYEIPVLEICAEVYYRSHYDYDKLFDDFKKETEDKLAKIRDGAFNLETWSEFGARRRLSYNAQDWLIGRLVEEKRKYPTGAMKGFVGTSNVYLAMKYNVKAVGTMAHEFVELFQGHRQYNLSYSNWFAMDSWIREYGVWNGIALTDTLGLDIFLKDFNRTFATVFSGVRHDSGDPIVWGDKMIAHYKKLGIDPSTKTLLFSDSLDGEKATKIADYFKGKANVAFGIGTWWSAPQNIKPLNIVCKTVLVNGGDVVKLSDSPGKCMCRNPEYIDFAKRAIEWRLQHETN